MVGWRSQARLRSGRSDSLVVAAGGKHERRGRPGSPGDREVRRTVPGGPRRTRFIGRHLTFVPLAGITIGPNSLQIPVSKEEVKEAPNIETEGERLARR
jgi:hypothetical protein